MKYFVATIIIGFFSTPSYAIDPVAPKPAPRRLASVPATQTITPLRVKGRKPRRSFEGRLGIAAGHSAVTDSDTMGSDGSNLLLGANADFREFTYAGAELDFFYGLPAKRGLDDKAEMFGVSAFLKAQLPLQLGFARLTPKIGAGYGFFSLTETYDVSLEGSTDRTLLHSPMAMAGFDVTLFQDFTLSFDYSQSIGAKGKRETVFFGETAEDVLSEVQMVRMRTSALYRITDHILLGVQYARRTYKFFVPLDQESRSSYNPIQNQFMGLLFYEL